MRIVQAGEVTAILVDVDGTLVDSSPFEDALFRAAVREVLGPLWVERL